MDFDLIDRIEVIRGPGSALYGTDAFFAVINVISKRGAEFKGAEVSGDVGSLNTYHSRVTFGTKSKGGIDWLLSGTYYPSLGNKRVFYAECNAPATNDGYAIDADGGRFGRVYGSMEYRGLRLAAAYVSRNKDLPTAPFGTVFTNIASRPRSYTIPRIRFLEKTPC